MSNADSEIAFGLQQKIKNNELTRRGIFADNVRILAEIKEKEYYKILLGDSEATWAGFLADTEIFYTRNQIKSMLMINSTYGEKLQLAPSEYLALPQSRLIDIVPVVTKETWEDWKPKIELLTSKDWKIEVRKAKGQITEEDEEHEHEYEGYQICKACGAKHKTSTVEAMKKGDK